MKSKIDSLIQQEVKSGKLTSDQATELQNVFANALPQGGPGGPGGSGGASQSGGSNGSDALQILLSLTGSSSSSDSSSTTSASSTGSDSSTSSGLSTSTDLNNLLQDFLKLVQDSTGTKTGYDSTGQSTSQSAALLLNYQS